MRYLITFLILLIPALVSAQPEPVNPCKSDSTIQTTNPNRIYFESKFHDLEITQRYVFAVRIKGNFQSQQEWDLPKTSATLAFTPTLPDVPCYWIPYTPAPTLNKMGTVQYIHQYRIVYNAPAGNSEWSADSNPFILLETPYVGAIRNGQ